MKLSEVAQLIGGQLIGEDKEISGVAGLEEAGSMQLSFLTNPKYKEAAQNTKAAAVIVEEKSIDIKTAQLVCPNPYLGLAKLLTYLYPRPIPEIGIHPTAVVEKDVILGENVSIGTNVYVGWGCKLGANVVLRSNVVLEAEVEIGDETWIYSNVSIREKVRIGKRVIIHSGSVIGGDGFGYAHSGDGSYFKIPQVGIVVIEDEVEIGSNVTIDRATLGCTFIGRGTKIDNLVMVAHNVEIGENCILVGQMGISGSTKIGNNCTLAGQVGIAGHVTIGDNVVVAGRSGVTKDISANQQVAGFPAVPINQERRRKASLAMLPETLKEIKQIEERLTTLEKQLIEEEEEDGLIE